MFDATKLETFEGHLTQLGGMTGLVFLFTDPDRAKEIMVLHDSPLNLGYVLKHIQNIGAFDFAQDATPENTAQLLQLMLDTRPLTEEQILAVRLEGIPAEGQA
jgi:hypothetical protein